MATYGQFCPVAIGSEVLAERWTPLVIRELISGSKRFSDLHRGVPLMSPSLLSKRLKSLERAGIVERVAADSRGVEYRLTHAGLELEPIIVGIGQWGMRWIRGRDLRDEHLDASLLMWDMRRSVVTDRLPPEHTVAHFHLQGSIDKKSHFWLVIDRPEVDLCLVDPGYEPDLEVAGHVATLTQIWMGDRSFADAIDAGDLSVVGSRPLVRGFPAWFSLSRFAGLQHR